MFADHHYLPVLIGYLDAFHYEAKTGFFVIGLRFDLHLRPDRIPDKHGANKPQTVIAIGHGDFIDKVGGQADGDAENEGTVGDPMFKGLRIAPFFVHMMREKIACLPGMENDIRFRDRAAGGVAGVAGLELFVVLLHFKQS